MQRGISPDKVVAVGKGLVTGKKGGVRIVGTRPLPGGGDIGVESLGFVPPRPRPGLRAYLADRSLPESDFPGTESVLSVSWGALRRAGAAPGDLLAATEGQARTIRVRCGRQRCTNRLVATGPDIAHAESIVAFTRGP